MNAREAGDRTRSERIAAARSFMAAHGRVLDRRRFELLFDGADAEPVLAALRAYRNSDGGYGHGLEPDLRAPESQPAAAWHAFEVFAGAAPVTAPEAAELCDYLDAIALPRRRAAARAPDRGPEWLRAVLGAGRSAGLLAPDHRDRRGARHSRRRSRSGGRRPSMARPGDELLPRRDRRARGCSRGVRARFRLAAPRRGP